MQGKHTYTYTHTLTLTYTHKYASLYYIVFHYEIKQPELPQQQQLISLDKNKLHKYLKQATWLKRGL